MNVRIVPDVARSFRCFPAPSIQAFRKPSPLQQPRTAWAGADSLPTQRYPTHIYSMTRHRGRLQKNQHCFTKSHLQTRHFLASMRMLLQIETLTWEPSSVSISVIGHKMR